MKADAKTVTVKAKVKNTGSRYSGKQVVQVYFSAPQTGLDKPYQQLAGYAKTDTLKPGASQVVTVQYKTTDMAPTTQELLPTCLIQASTRSGSATPHAPLRWRPDSTWTGK